MALLNPGQGMSQPRWRIQAAPGIRALLQVRRVILWVSRVCLLGKFDQNQESPTLGCNA